MTDPKYEERKNHESIATARQWSQADAVHWRTPQSYEAGFGRKRTHRSFAGGNVRHIRYPDILFPVETVDP